VRFHAKQLRAFAHVSSSILLELIAPLFDIVPCVCVAFRKTKLFPIFNFIATSCYLATTNKTRATIATRYATRFDSARRHCSLRMRCFCAHRTTREIHTCIAAPEQVPGQGNAVDAQSQRGEKRGFTSGNESPRPRSDFLDLLPAAHNRRDWIIDASRLRRKSSGQ